MHDESTLIDALRRGDEAAFRGFVMKHHAGLVRVARGYVGSNAVAEEVAQDTWLAAITGLPSFEGRSSIKTWLYRIVINKAQTRGQREARFVPIDFTVGVDEYPSTQTHHQTGNRQTRFHWRTPPNDWGGLPESIVESAETRQLIEQAMTELPSAQRMVMTMRDLDGLTSSEVCELLGISEANQRVLLHRARGRVRLALDSHFMALADGKKV